MRAVLCCNEKNQSSALDLMSSRSPRSPRQRAARAVNLTFFDGLPFSSHLSWHLERHLFVATASSSRTRSLEQVSRIRVVLCQPIALLRDPEILFVPSRRLKSGYRPLAVSSSTPEVRLYRSFLDCYRSPRAWRDRIEPSRPHFFAKKRQL